MITSPSSFPVYVPPGFECDTPLRPALFAVVEQGKRGRGRGKWKGAGEGEGQSASPPPLSPAGGALPPGAALLSPPLSPPLAPSFVKLRAGLSTVLGFPLAAPEPCRRMQRPLQEALAAWQDWLGSEPAKLTFAEVPGRWRRRFVSRQRALALQQKQYCRVSFVRLPRYAFTKDSSSLQQE